MKRKQLALAIAAATLMSGSGLAVAHDAGDFIVRGGWSMVDPKSNNNPVVDVDDGSSLTINFAYMLTDRWSVELLAAYPFEHDIYLKGTNVKVGKTKHLPPTLNLQYHLNPTGAFQPYVGAGINYTTFFSEKAVGPLEGASLSLKDSWGYDLEIGFDWSLSGNWLLNGNVRYIDIDSGAFVNGTGIGDVTIDPMVYGIHLGYKF